MKSPSRHRSAVALAAALLFASAAVPALAQNTKQDASGNTAATQPASNDTSQSTQDQTMRSPDQAAGSQQLSAHDRESLKLSEEGLTAMQSVHAARIAIFQGDTKAAQQMLTAAQSSLKDAAKDATKLQGGTKGANGTADSTSADASGSGQSSGSTQTANSGTDGSADNKADYVAIDGRMSVADGFVVTPTSNSDNGGKAQDANSGQSNAQAKGDNAKEQVELAAVGATFTRVMMPLQATTKQVDSALQLVAQQKYYEASQALKTAEEGLVLDVVMLDGVPADNAQNAQNASNSHANTTGQNPAPAKQKS